MQTTLKNNLYYFSGSATWKELLATKNYLKQRGNYVQLEELADSIDKTCSPITAITLMVPYQLALYLYNTANEGIHLDSDEGVVSMKSGFGNSGTVLVHRVKDKFHEIQAGLHTKDWHKCDPTWFYWRFCSKLQWELIQELFM